MARKDSILIEDEWINLNSLALPAGVSVPEVEKILIVKPIKISLEVILPKGTEATDFDYKKNAELKKFRATVESKTTETIGLILDQDQASEGTKDLEKLNSYLEKATKAFRVTLRSAVAKSIGPSCKPDDLMTAGSVQFVKIEFQFGFGDSSEEKFPLLDLSKAFKRIKKVQQLGVAWKANKLVISVRFRKPFKQAELKELRELLPEGSSRGANMLAGEFFAHAKGNVDVNFPENSTLPHELLLRKAFKKQSGQAVNTNVGTMVKEKNSDSKAKKPEDKGGKKQK